MSPVGWIHTAFALVALISGTVVVLSDKGTQNHRRWGWVFVASMVLLNITALTIYRLFGRFGPFHVAALVSLVGLVSGIVPVIRRRPGWVERHYFGMSYAYVGLLAAAAAEVATRVPGTVFWWAVAGGTLLVFAVGATLITRNAKPILRRFSPPPPKA